MGGGENEGLKMLFSLGWSHNQMVTDPVAHWVWHYLIRNLEMVVPVDVPAVLVAPVIVPICPL